MKKEYIKKQQQGGYLSMDAIKKKLQLTTATQDKTSRSSKPLESTGVVRNFLTGDMVRGDQTNSPGATLPTSQTRRSEKVTTAVDKPWRDKLRSGLDYLDRDGKSEVAKPFTDVGRSLINLSQPSVYTKNIHNDSDVLSAVGKFAGDLGNAAMVADGAGRLLKYKPAGLEEVNAARQEWEMGRAYDSGNDHDLERLMENQWDPRNIGEIAVDNLHNSEGYGQLADRMNKSGVLTNLRRAYVNKKYIQDAPMTADNIDAFMNTRKPIMRGNGMIIARDGANSQVVNSKFGDRVLQTRIQGMLGGKDVNLVPERYADYHRGSLINDTSNGDPQIFSSALDAKAKTITDYSFFAKPDKLRDAAKFADNFQRNAPDWYAYDPGSLSGDSYTTTASGAARMGDRYVPTNIPGRKSFGSPSSPNGFGVNSGLSRDLAVMRDATSTDEMWVAAQNSAISKSRKLGDKLLTGLNVPEETKSLIMQNLDRQGFPSYIKTPTMKVPAGWKVGDAIPEGIRHRPIDYSQYNTALREHMGKPGVTYGQEELSQLATNREYHRQRAAGGPGSGRTDNSLIDSFLHSDTPFPSAERTSFDLSRATPSARSLDQLNASLTSNDLVARQPGEDFSTYLRRAIQPGPAITVPSQATQALEYRQLSPDVLRNLRNSLPE